MLMRWQLDSWWSGGYQCIKMWNHYVVHLTLILYVNCTSIKKRETQKEKEGKKILLFYLDTSPAVTFRPQFLFFCPHFFSFFGTPTKITTYHKESPAFYDSSMSVLVEMKLGNECNEDSYTVFIPFKQACWWFSDSSEDGSSHLSQSHSSFLISGLSLESQHLVCRHHQSEF